MEPQKEPLLYRAFEVLSSTQSWVVLVSLSNSNILKLALEILFQWETAPENQKGGFGNFCIGLPLET